jgi:hypothetical protein
MREEAARRLGQLFPFSAAVGARVPAFAFVGFAAGVAIALLVVTR